MRGSGRFCWITHWTIFFPCIGGLFQEKNRGRDRIPGNGKPGGRNFGISPFPKRFGKNPGLGNFRVIFGPGGLDLVSQKLGQGLEPFHSIPRAGFLGAIIFPGEFCWGILFLKILWGKTRGESPKFGGGPLIKMGAHFLAQGGHSLWG